MCTLSVIATGTPGGFRVVHNRDELRSRAIGEAPAWRDVAGADGVARRAIYPVDPDAGGTWIAARDDGVVYAILNVNPSADAGSPAASRGRVISDLLARPANAVLRHPDSERMRSYRVVRVRRDGDAVVVEEHRSFGADRTDRRAVLDGPRVWVSSGLGDEAVEPRVRLFEAMVGGEGEGEGDPLAGAQDAYHRHVWADRPEISVLMSRGDARTTAISTVDVGFGADGSAAVEMGYEAVPDDGGGRSG